MIQLSGKLRLSRITRNVFDLFEENTAFQVTILVIVTFIITAKGITEWEPFFFDSSRHALNGAFLYDLIRDLPFDNFVAYAWEWYARYPALTIGFHPPLFPAVEAFFYLLFGISFISARVAVMSFAFVAVITWYAYIKSIYDKQTAFFSGLLLITIPLVVEWSREPMLEMPALAMIILSFYFYHKAIVSGKTRYLYYLALAIGSSMLIKQTTVFIIPVFFTHLVLTGQYKRLFEKRMIVPYAILGLVSILLTVMAIKFGRSNLDLTVVSSQGRAVGLRQTIDVWFYYITALPNILSAPVLILSFIGVVLILSKKLKLYYGLFLLWIVLGYLFFSYIIWVREWRYAYFWVPPFALFATLCITSLNIKYKNLKIATGLLIIVSAYQIYHAYIQYNAKVTGYDEAARYVIDHPKGNSVLFSGHFMGNFIFHMRKYDKHRNVIVLRGDKVLTRRTDAEQNYGEEDVYNSLRMYGTKYVVLESKNPEDWADLSILLKVIKSDKFILRKRIKAYHNIAILIYEFKEDVTLSAKSLTLPVMKMGGVEITVPIKPDMGFQ